MCRKDLTVKSTPKTKSSLTTPLRQPDTRVPYSSRLSEETGQQITYQEFLNTINQSSSYQQNTGVEVNPPLREQPRQVNLKPISTGQKLLKIALCLGILIAIVVVVVIIL